MILVTGGAGFIGGNYAIRHFKNNSEALLIVDKFTYAANLETIKTVISDSRKFIDTWRHRRFRTHYENP